MPDATPVCFLITVAVIAEYSIYGCHLWEDPIRNSSWLTGSSRARRREPGTLFSEKYKLTALSALFVVTATVVASR